MHHPCRKATPQSAIHAVLGSEIRSKPFHRLTSLLVASLALIAVFYAPAANGQANVIGTWQTVSTQMPINPIHTALLSNGKILVVSGSGNYPAQTIYNVGVWDPSTNTITTQTQSWDMFCNGMIVLPDGRPFIMGGNLQYDPFFGWNRTSIYNPTTDKYTDMEDMAHGRWYPTSTLLGDGRVLIFSGLDESGATNSQTEIYTVGGGWAPAVTAPWIPPLYPRLHLLPNGKIFYSGSTTQSRTFDPSTNTWSGVIAITKYGGTRTYGSSVLLPLTPPNYVPKVMIFGGGNPATATTEIIDLSAATPAWASGPDMSKPRIEMNATILPNGKILTVGGSLNDEDAASASLHADLYDPVANTMSSAGANAVPRLYHSVALLLPDATVWVAGGNPTRGTYEPSVEIYSPPYLFNPNGTPATRPAIATAPSVIGYGATFQVQTPDAANIASAVLVKDGAVTHAFNMDQRLVGLAFAAGSGVLTVTGPPNGNVAPPGYYMLFLINNAGVPSVAKFVQVSTAPTDVPPSGTITTPATDVSIPQGQSVTFAGSGAATGGNTISGYSWSIRGGSPAKSSIQNPGAVTFATPGVYQATLTVTDSLGITDPNPPVRTITVTAASPAPTLASATPNTGTQAQTNLNIVLTGTNFLANPICSFGAGIEVNSCTFNSATQVTANVDILAGAAVGPRNIIVTNTDTQIATLPNGFSVVAGTALPAPTLTAVTPNAEFQGTTNATITLTGTNFQPAPTCNFNTDFGGSENTCTFVSPTQINVNLNVSANATLGGHNVSVTNADGQSATIINGFTVAENLGNTVQLGAGFTAGALVMNGSAQLKGSVLDLTDGNQFEASSAWYATRVNVQNFVTDFTFQVTPGTTADGFTFALQANSTTALGVAGGPLGYGLDSSTGTGGIPNSVAVKFDLYDNFGEGSDSTGFYVNGASPTIPFVDMTGSGIDLHSGDIFDVHMIYGGGSLAMTITDTVTKAMFTHTWTIDIPTTIGATTAYAGFTGGTGGVTATQNILTWTLGPTPVVGFSPASPIDFPDVVTGTSAAPISITVTNTGGATLNISSVTVTGTNASDFAIASTTNCTTVAIAVSSTCTVTVTFTPSGTGQRQANLQFTDDASSSPQILALTGNGLAPATPGVTVTPGSPIMLPSTTQGATSAPLVVTVTNSGNANLNVTALTLTGVNSGDFALASNTCTGTITAGATCTVGITFTPSATGTRQASLQITDNAPASPQTFALTGMGISLTPAVVISPATVAVAATQGTAGTSTNIMISNSGNAPLHISGVVFGGANVSEFVNPTNPCVGTAIAPGANCPITVMFAPLGVGTRTETVTITDDATNSPQAITVNGTASPVYTLTSASSALTTAVNAGQTAQYTLQLTPGMGYSGSVTMACSGAPATTLCTVTNPIQLTTGTPTSLNVTVSTMARSLPVPNRDRQPNPPVSRYLMLLLFSMCVAALAVLKQLKQSGGFAPRRLAYSTGLLILLLVGSGIAGCASGGTSVVTPTPGTSGTQKGTYTLTLTPTASSMSGKPLQLSPIQLTLTVN